MLKQPLTVAWISDFPIEWLQDIPEVVRALPRRQPATWQMVLLAEFEKNPAIRTHIIVLRRSIARNFSFERNGTVFHVLKATGKQRLVTFFWLDTLLIRRVCRSIRPDLIHAWGSEKGASLIASRLPYPYVMTIQGLFAWLKQMVKLHPYAQFVEWVERISLNRAKVVTTESNFAVRFLAAHFQNPNILQAEHAPNPIFARVARRPVTLPINLLSVGTLGHMKGTDLLFAALDRIGVEIDFKLTIITNPNPRHIELLRATVSERTWLRTEFKHDLLPNEVAAELATATMLLMPTRADNSPNAVKEAVVAGVPVVASKVGGIPDYVIHGKNGLLFPTGDLEAFTQAIRSACAHPLFGCGRVDLETCSEKRNYLSAELMAKNFIAAYEAALAIP